MFKMRLRPSTGTDEAQTGRDVRNCINKMAIFEFCTLNLRCIKICMLGYNINK